VHGCGVILEGREFGDGCTIWSSNFELNQDSFFGRWFDLRGISPLVFHTIAS
jgi:hypothetical protein